MASSPVFWWITAVWVSLILMVAVVTHASSGLSWMLVMIAGVVPPLMLRTLWNDGPPPTIAEVLHATEVTR